MLGRKAPLRCYKPMKRTKLKVHSEAVTAPQARRVRSAAKDTDKAPNASRALKARKAMPRKREKTSAELDWEAHARKRDGNRCRWIDENGRRCRVTDEKITVHHIQTRRQRPDLVLDKNNSACLCDQHHDRAHHTVKGRQQAEAQGLLGGRAYEFRDR